ncbi:MAG: hypothetical protein ACK5MR_18825 [Cumulibacter sp.]
MVTAEEIRRRVQEADQKKIHERANAAADVAEAITTLTEAETALDTARAKLADSITTAQNLMNLAELATFTSTSVPKLTTWSKTTRTRRSRRSVPKPASSSAPDTSIPAAAE